MLGIISDIQRFSVHDGPGIRTTVFLKGCNMRCAWCHNPETLRAHPELRVDIARCLGCGACVRACVQGAHVLTGAVRFARERCQVCGACALACSTGGVALVGRSMSPAAVLEEVLRDRAFYIRSGGGVTLSGGEPCLQTEFSATFLAMCKDAALHTAIETNLSAPWKTLVQLLPTTDLVMLDLKLLDNAAHRRWTGVSNRRVLANIQRLAVTGTPFIVRTPVVGGVNDTDEEITAIAAFLAPLPNLRYYELLAYHPLGSAKYHSLGYAPNTTFTTPSRERLWELGTIAHATGVAVRVLGEMLGPTQQT